MNRWTPETRDKFKKRIEELSAEGKSYAEIAATMTAEGFRTPNGAEVSMSIINSIRNPQHHARAADTGRDFIYTLIFAEDISPERRIKLLKTYLRAEDDAA